MPGRRVEVSLLSIHCVLSTDTIHPIPPPPPAIISTTTIQPKLPPLPPTTGRSFHTPSKLARCCASCANGLSCPYQRRFNLEEKEKKKTPIHHHHHHHSPQLSHHNPHQLCDVFMQLLFIFPVIVWWLWSLFCLAFSCYIWWDEVMLPLSAKPTLRGLSTAAAASPFFSSPQRRSLIILNYRLNCKGKCINGRSVVNAAN